MMSKRISLGWKQRRNKRYWLVGLAAVYCIGGVFAQWTQELLVNNEFRTAQYDTALEEEFVSPSDWLPGEQINKDVWVKNKGSVPVFAKLVIHQEWMRLKEVTDLEGNVIAPAAGEQIPLFFDGEQGKECAAQIKWGDQVMLLASGKNSELPLNLPVAERIEDAVGKWLLLDEQPDADGDYLLYYIGTIGAGETSPLVVDAVTMNPQIQPAILQKDTYYEKATKTWITTAKKNGTYDYECAEYTMLVTAVTVQATEDAVKEVFSETADSSAVVSYLASQAFEPEDL